MTEFFIATRPALAALCLAAFIYKLLSASNIRHDPATIALLACIASEAIGWTLTIPSVSQRLDLWLGLPNLSALLMRLLGAAVLSPSLLAAVFTWSNPAAEARRKTSFAVGYGLAVGTAMIGLWIAAAVDTRHDTFLVQNLNRPLVVIYLVIYELGFAAGLVALVRFSWSYARRVDDTWLRPSLRIIALGSGGYLVVCINQLISIPARLLGYGHVRWDVLTGISIRLGVVGIVTGLLLPSIAAQSGQVRTWWGHLRSFRALDDLWQDFNQAFPEVSLFDHTRAWRSYLSTEELHYLLSRRVIEIRDCWRALRPYLSDHPRDAPEDISALAAAAARSLHTALAARAAGEPADEESGASHLERLEVTDLDEDIEWLTQVGRAYSAMRPGRLVTTTG
ncbi:MAB_1171c family putative transporter [Nocardia sp. CA-128927]|uniref:MAB_1171c family putative transporter n=1 Tax=Nocardia sp. CA-128927 TaxID=3239975 RepID=UPI003D977622